MAARRGLSITRACVSAWPSTISPRCLFDPYVTLTDSERDDLLHYYAEHRGISLFELRESFHLCAAQRLMQALGAYGNLSRNLGKPHFKQHIPAAVASLTTVCESSDALRDLLPLFR